MANRGFLLSQRIQRWGLRGLFGVASSLHPAWAARQSLRFFLSPRLYQRPGWEQDLLAQGERLDFPGDLAVWKFGHGPKRALLVHGWDGRGSQLGRFLPALLEEGFEVILFDFPAHGDSSGKHTHLGEWIDTLGDLAQAFGKFDVVIAHSLGGTAALLAAAMGSRFQPKALVTIGSPNEIGEIFEQFYELIGLQGSARRHFEVRLKRHTGLDARLAVPTNLAESLGVPLLIVHDENDDAIRVAHGEEMARQFASAHLLKTRGLGHRRILKSREVIEDILDFLLDLSAKAQSDKKESASSSDSGVA